MALNSEERAADPSAELHRLQRDLDDLMVAAETRAVVEQAKGVLVCHYGCQPDDAFELLGKAAAEQQVPLHALALRLVERAASGRLAGPGRDIWDVADA